MADLFNVILYKPVFNLFVGFYNVVPNVAIVITIVTLIIKFVLYPLTASSLKAQQSLRELQPKIKALKEKYKDDQQMLAQETMKLYKENKVNPFGSCLPILIQIPVFLALYWVLQNGLTTDDFSLLYSFVDNPGHIQAVVYGIDFAKPNIFLALLAGAAQFLYAKLMVKKPAPKEAGEGSKDENMMAMMNKNMLYFMPLITIVISMQLPSGLALYWFLSTAASAGQHMWLFRHKKKETGDVIEGEIVNK